MASMQEEARLPRSVSKLELALKEFGEKDTLEYRVQAMTDKEQTLSLWHDLPLMNDEFPGCVNYINEIPKWTRKKYEIATTEPANPIKQDEKKGKLREFKKGDIYFNYGCLPRTWEDPAFVHSDLTCEGVGGDNDPLDVCEIGLRQIQVGEVRPCKVLGILCMIDDGEADWKVVVIDAEDRWASELNDIQDVEQLLPGTLDNIREWFRTYKIPDGKPPNVFGLEERFMNSSYAFSVIEETHEAWKRLCDPKAGVPKKELSVPDLASLDPVSIQDDGTLIIHQTASPNLGAEAGGEDPPSF